MAAHLSRVNIGFKSSAGLFVPAGALGRLLHGLGLTEPTELDVAGGRVAWAVASSKKRGAGEVTGGA